MVLGIPPAALCWSTRALGRAVRVMAEERAAFFQVSPGELSQQSPAGGTGCPVTPGTITSPYSQYPVGAAVKE